MPKLNKWENTKRQKKKKTNKPNRAKHNIHRHIIFKLLKTKLRKKILMTCRGTKIKIIAEFS